MAGSESMAIMNKGLHFTHYSWNNYDKTGQFLRIQTTSHICLP